MVNIKSYDNQVRRILQEPLKEMGFFEKERLFFIKKEDKLVKTLAFGGRIDSKVNNYRFSGTAGICFIEIEKIYRPELLNDITPTIMIPLHLLHEDRLFYEWSLGENESETELSTAIKREIELYAIPFFIEFSNIDILQKHIESSKPEDWFILNPDQRICILGIIEFIKGNTNNSLTLFRNALEERKDALPKRKKDIEKVFNRILGLVNQTK